MNLQYFTNIKGSIDDRNTLTLISEVLREDVLAIEKILDSAYGKLKSKKASF